MKKKILFVIPKLGIGGAEKSLIELLDRFNYNNYCVDLLLFQPEGELLKKVNKNVNLIYLSTKEQFIVQNIKKSYRNLIKTKEYTILLKKVIVSIVYRLFKRKINDSALFWRVFNSLFEKNDRGYDVAISYLQGISAYYTIDKVNAKKKILWMHTDYSQYNKNSYYDKKYNSKYDAVVTVSENAMKNFIHNHPDMSNKVKVIYNIVDTNNILKLANIPNELDKNTFKIVSVGRLHYAKGFDLVIPAISKLINDGINVKWYVIGEGPERSKLEKLIRKYNLNNTCYLLGSKENPYTYINSADLYLQSSRYEGYCITLTEAKILNKPIVTTDFFGAREQIEHMKTGLIVNCTVNDIYYGLRKLIIDKDLRNKIIRNVSELSIDNSNEITKVYELIEN